MLTVIIKRNDEPTVIQMTQEAIMRELSQINGSEMLLEDSWSEGLKKVRTLYVCLVEADCVLSANYISSNIGLITKATSKGYSGDGRKGGAHGGGGLNKLAMLSSCVGVKTFANRIYNYKLDKDSIQPERKKHSTNLYNIQVGFVPGAIMRYKSIKELIGEVNWDSRNLIELSTKVSFHLWSTNRRVQVNPNTTYISNEGYLESPPFFSSTVPESIVDIFQREDI